MLALHILSLTAAMHDVCAAAAAWWCITACLHRRLEQELAEVNATMSDLRTKLYARLGDSINLDVPHSAAASKA
jgi:hypothetical protein